MVPVISCNSLVSSFFRFFPRGSCFGFVESISDVGVIIVAAIAVIGGIVVSVAASVDTGADEVSLSLVFTSWVGVSGFEDSGVSSLSGFSVFVFRFTAFRFFPGFAIDTTGISTDKSNVI